MQLTCWSGCSINSGNYLGCGGAASLLWRLGLPVVGPGCQGRGAALWERSWCAGLALPPRGQVGGHRRGQQRRAVIFAVGVSPLSGTRRVRGLKPRSPAWSPPLRERSV